MNEEFNKRVGADRLASRQVDELIGIAHGLIADGQVNDAEVAFLEKWLAANLNISDQPMIRVLYTRVAEIMSDAVVDSEEKAELLDTLNNLVRGDFELGEILKPTTLPLCEPAPHLIFPDRAYCFTGTFSFGQRKACENAITERGGTAGSLTRKTDVLVIGAYATESWKHSSFGNKILKASAWRDEGLPISIVSEEHWVKHL